MDKVEYKELPQFMEASRAQELVIENLEYLHKCFCANVIDKILYSIKECKTGCNLDGNDYRLNPNHPIMQEFKKTMEEKGYSIHFEMNPSDKTIIRWVQVDWKIKEKVDE